MAAEALRSNASPIDEAARAPAAWPRAASFTAESRRIS